MITSLNEPLSSALDPNWGSSAGLSPARVSLPMSRMFSGGSPAALSFALGTVGVRWGAATVRMEFSRHCV